MTVSEFIFSFLQEKGCEKVFMVSGSSAMWLTDALCRNDKLEAICCHHEQAAAMAADGYGRVNGIPGVCLVTIGPGATNAITGVAQAYLDSSPMFVISGQANSRLLKYEMEHPIRQHGTQSLNLENIVAPITKYFKAIMKPEEIAYSMEKAYHEAISGRPGPVWIDVPVDIQNKPISNEMEHYAVEEIEDAFCAAKDLDLIIEKILAAKQPLILAGNGVRCACVCEELEEIAQMAHIPVAISRGGIDILPSDFKYFVGRPGSYGDRASHSAIQKCDLLLVLGSRLSVSTIGYYPDRLAPNAYKIMIDIDKNELEKDDVPIDKKIQADLSVFLKKLNAKMQEKEFDEHLEWINYCLQMKEKYPNVLPEYEKEEPLNSYYFTKILSDHVSADCNIVVDTGSVCNIVSQSWNLKKGQRYLISGGLSCMGFWATSIGACQKGKQVVALAGDGSTQMNVQEFATLAYNRLPVKLFVYNNNGYMLIRHNQHNYMNDRFLGVGPDSGLQTPDFVKVAQAYGLKAVRIAKGDDIVGIVNEVMKYDGPVVCEIMVQEFAPIVPRIASRVMPDGSLKAAEFDDLYPFLD